MEYKKEFEILIDCMKKKHALDIDLVLKAFEFAERLHSGQTRKGGLPYISHPVAVAHILEKLDFDANVICGGLLHDTVEDCGYTVEEMKKDFNPTIAKIVDGVTAIEGNFNTLSEDEFPKLLDEVLTYQKLMNIGKENLFAFYIKFADRLHNLSTISPFAYYKQMEKVKETEKWILPIIKLLKARRFYLDIQNECFKIKYKDSLENYQNIYSKYFNYNQKDYSSLKENLGLLLAEYHNKIKTKNELREIIIQPCTELETFEIIKNTMIINNVTEIKQSYLNKFPITKIYFVLKSNYTEKELSNLLFNFLNYDHTKKLLKISGYEIDDFSKKTCFVATDSARIKYQVYIFTTKSYFAFRNGTTEGVDLSFIDDTASEAISKYLEIKTPANEKFMMPENSTVLDFAFKIHKDLGFSVKYAFLNGAPTKTPIYAKLTDGDKVELVIAKDEKTGLTKNIAQLRWLMYCKTDLAQKSLVHYFESKLIE